MTSLFKTIVFSAVFPNKLRLRKKHSLSSAVERYNENNAIIFKNFVNDTLSQSQKITHNNQRNILKMPSLCM